MSDGEATAFRGRLGIHNDAVFRWAETTHGRKLEVWNNDLPFLLFAGEVGKKFESLTLFGRTTEAGLERAFVRLPVKARLAELPYYPDLRQLGQVLRAARGTLRAFAHGLDDVDVVWAIGPHPFSFFLIAQALRRRKRVVLGVRADVVRYYRSRMPSRRWYPMYAVIVVMDSAYRLLARRFRTIVVGADNARRYERGRAPALPMVVSLIRANELAKEPSRRDWRERVMLLTVGRIDPEKNPFLLVDAMATLERRHPGRFRLLWVGDGRLEDDVKARVRAAGLEHLIELPGFVPFGPDLLALYRGAHAFVHVSRTEGVPQVLVEALCAGLPVIGTDVGGVAEVLDRGKAGLLVPAESELALVDAVVRLADDEKLRERIATRGLEVARGLTLEAQADRVVRFLAA